MKSPERKKPDFRILGIDPGSIACGYGLISLEANEPRYVASGRIAVPATRPLQERLKQIFESLREIIRSHQPDTVVVEKVFFANSVKAALSLGHARGVVLLAAAIEDTEMHEYSALQVKQAVVGYGRAEKKQVQDMVKMILSIKGMLYPDSADALALALCHANTLQFKKAVRDSEKKGQK